MDYCWWNHRKRKEERIAHIVDYSRKFLGLEIYTAYCGKRTIHNERKKYGKVEDVIKDSGKVCMECWHNLPRKLLMEITHLA